MSVPVLVIGAGPAGLTTAVALAHYGVEPLLVERRPALSGLPRAASVSARTMELLRSWGLEQQVRAGGVDVEWKQWVGRTLTVAGTTSPTGFPTREQSAVLSPTSPASVPQDHLEPVLLGHLRSLGAARVELGTEVVDFDVAADGVRVTLRDVNTGQPRTLRARYLVAADGARSAVRDAIGIPMRGPGPLSRALGTEFRAPLWDVLGDRRYCLYVVTHPEAAGVFVPAGQGDRWIYGVEHEHCQKPPADYTPARATRLIQLGTGIADLQPRIGRIGTFTFAARLADRFRQGATFLVGDAAHQITPRGGTGMNTAVQSGYDLGWKLAWVLRGWAEPGLLDSYETERRPVAAHNVARSADPQGATRPAVQEMAADLGGRIPHIWIPTATGSASSLDLLGTGLTLFTAGRGTPWPDAAAAIAGPPPLTVRILDQIAARGLGIPAGGALLARPDGALAGWWPPATHAETALRAAVHAATGGGARAA